MSGLALLKKILTKKATIQDNKGPSIKQGEKDRNNNGANQRQAIKTVCIERFPYPNILTVSDSTKFFQDNQKSSFAYNPKDRHYNDLIADE